MKTTGVALGVLTLVAAAPPARADRTVATFSIVAADPAAGEVGIAVASRFFAVGSVVPYGRAGVGAVATQASADTTFGPRGLELLARGARPEEVVTILLRGDASADRRQLGLVASDGRSASYTGRDCGPWAGGRSGPGYAVQGNILAGEPVVAAMEAAFLASKGALAERMYAALLAGDAQGGDSRGRQSASLQVWKAKAGFGGGDDRAIDIRVDDHPEPFQELGRLLDYALMNSAWNEAWTLFMQKQPAEALPAMERAARRAPRNGEVQYDLAVVRLAAGDRDGARRALATAVELNPKLRAQAEKDPDLAGLER